MTERERLQAVANSLGVRGKVEKCHGGGGYCLIPAHDYLPDYIQEGVKWLGNYCYDVERSLGWLAAVAEDGYYQRLGEERYGYSSFGDPDHDALTNEYEWLAWWLDKKAS